MRHVHVGELRHDRLELLERKFHLLTEAKVKDKDRILKAVRKQDQIRKKYGKKEKGWDSVSIIRKWRMS